MKGSHCVLDPLASVVVRFREVSHLLSEVVLRKSRGATGFLGQGVHQFGEGSGVDLLLAPIFVVVEEVPQHFESLSVSLLLGYVIDGLGHFEGVDAEGKSMQGVAVAEHARMIRGEGSLYLPPLLVEIDTVGA